MSRSAEASRTRLIGAQSLGVLVLGVAGLAFACYLAIYQAGESGVYGDRVQVSLVSSVGAVFVLLIASARITCRDEKFIMVALFVYHEVPFSQLMRTDAENGFALVLISGRRIESIAFGPSLIAMMTGNRRGRRIARRVDRIVPGLPKAVDGWVQDSVTTHPRTGAVMSGLSFVVLSLVISVL